MKELKSKKKLFFTIIFFSIYLHIGVSEIHGNFLTRDEYAKMLYVDPRGGISCAKCHGTFGGGKIIDKHWDSKQKKFVELRTKPLYKLKPSHFKKAFERKIKLMPKYFFTEMEIKALYYFVFKNSELYVKYLEKVKNKKQNK
jgi:hypothetical protein